jgi:6-phosphogluconolactonase
MRSKFTKMVRGTVLCTLLSLVACGGNTFSVGGTISGLSGTVVLQNNGTSNLSISANGAFTFAGYLTGGSAYNVTVFSQPTDQTCTVSSGNGTVNSTVTNVIVNCASISPPRFAYVANAGGTISQYTIATGGALTAMTTATVTAGTTPNSIAVDRSVTYAYVANSGSDDIWQYAISKDVGKEGALTKIATTNLPPYSAPYSITLNPSGTYAYVVNSGSGRVYQYAINSSSGALVDTLVNTVAGKNPRCIVIHPSGSYAYVVNSGSDDISQYSVGTDGALKSMPTPSVSLPAGSAPYSITIATSPSDSSTYYAYVANSGSVGSVSQYTIDKNGNLIAMTTSAAVSAGTKPYSVTVDPSGKYAYVANADSSNISQYTIGTGGALAPITTAATVGAGSTPRSVTVDPSGQYVYAANFGNNNISQYTIGGGGALVSNTASATVIAGANPTFIITVR